MQPFYDEAYFRQKLVDCHYFRKVFLVLAYLGSRFSIRDNSKLIISKVCLRACFRMTPL